jgi:hypothetical protein
LWESVRKERNDLACGRRRSRDEEIAGEDEGGAACSIAVAAVCMDRNGVRLAVAFVFHRIGVNTFLTFLDILCYPTSFIVRVLNSGGILAWYLVVLAMDESLCGERFSVRTSRGIHR